MKITCSVNDHCPLCLKKGKYFKLKVYQINLEEATEMCENIECPFPFVKGVKSVVFQRNISNITEPQAPLEDDGKLPVHTEGSHDDSCIMDMGSSLSNECGDFDDSFLGQDPNEELLRIYNELNILAEKFEDVSNKCAVNSDHRSLVDSLKTCDEAFKAFQFDDGLSCSSIDSLVLENNQYELEHNYCKHSFNTPSCDVSQVTTEKDC